MMKYIGFILFYILGGTMVMQSQISITDVVNTGSQIAKTAKTSKHKLDRVWFSTAAIEFIVSNTVEYSYGILDSNGKIISGSDRQLNEKVAYGVLYSINYPIINKLTLGAVGGLQHQIQPQITSLKMGGILRYHFVDYDNVNTYMLTAYNISLTDAIESGMGNVRFGLVFPIKKLTSFNLTLNLFWDYNLYRAKKPFFYGASEKPGNFHFRAYGISVGVKL